MQEIEYGAAVDVCVCVRACVCVCVCVCRHLGLFRISLATTAHVSANTRYLPKVYGKPEHSLCHGNATRGGSPIAGRVNSPPPPVPILTACAAVRIAQLDCLMIAVS